MVSRGRWLKRIEPARQETSQVEVRRRDGSRRKSLYVQVRSLYYRDEPGPSETLGQLLPWRDEIDREGETVLTVGVAPDRCVSFPISEPTGYDGVTVSLESPHGAIYEFTIRRRPSLEKFSRG